MQHLSHLTFRDGTLIATANGVPYEFDRPATLAQSRFNLIPIRHCEQRHCSTPQRHCEQRHCSTTQRHCERSEAIHEEISTPTDLLAFIYRTLPFARHPLPPITLSDSFTPAAHSAFSLLLNSFPTPPHNVIARSEATKQSTTHYPLPTLKVLRGEVDDYILFAVRDGGSWHVGCLTKNAITLTIRFEDLWLLLPEELRSYSYTAEVTRDPTKQDKETDVVHESIYALAPDVRIFLEAKAGGGFVVKLF